MARSVFCFSEFEYNFTIFESIFWLSWFSFVLSGCTHVGSTFISLLRLWAHWCAQSQTSCYESIPYSDYRPDSSTSRQLLGAWAITQRCAQRCRPCAIPYVPKDMLNPCPYAGFGFVAGFLAVTQWRAVDALVDLAYRLVVFEVLFLPFWTAGTVRPNLLAPVFWLRSIASNTWLSCTLAMSLVSLSMWFL